MGLNTTPFGQNNASGPAANATVAGAAVLVAWSAIASGATPGTTVPCTGKVTSRFRVTYSVQVQNTTGAAVNATAAVVVNGVNIVSGASQDTLPLTTGVGTLTGVAEVQTTFPSTVPQTFGISVNGAGTTIVANGSVMDIQEIDAATG